LGVSRPKLDRASQRYNYGLAVAGVLVIVGLVIVSPRIVVDGVELPVLVVALLAAAFLFGLGQMVLGISRRRRYLRSLDGGEPPREGPGA
jgi:hypothetical protein